MDLSTFSQTTDFILFPIFTLLKKYSSILKQSQQQKATRQKNEEDIVINIAKQHLESVIQILSIVIKKDLDSEKKENSIIWLRNQSREIINHLTLIFPFFSILSEEIKLQSVTCLYDLFSIRDEKEDFSIWLQTNFSQNLLAFLISTLLDISTQERNRDLKILALRVIEIIIQQGARIVAICFLPGIVSSLTKIITGDFKQGSKVIRMALTLFATVVIKVLNNEDNSELLIEKDSNPDILSPLRVWNKDGSKLPEKEIKKSKKSRKPPASPFEQELDKEWLSETVDKLKQVIELIFPSTLALSHQLEWKFRLTLVESVSSIILSCYRTLESCLPVLIDIIVLHLHDDYELVARTSQITLSKLAIQLPDSLVSLLKKNLYSIFTALPRQIRTSNDNLTIDSLKRVLGYLTLLGTAKQIEPLIHSSLPHITTSLFQMLEFNLYDVQKVSKEKSTHIQFLENPSSVNPIQLTQPLQEEETKKNENVFPMSSTYFYVPLEEGYPHKVFKHFINDKIFQYLGKICKLLGYYGETFAVIDHFLSVLKDTNLNKFYKQTIFIINEVILGSHGIGIENEVSVWSSELSKVDQQTEKKKKMKDSVYVEQILQIYLAPHLFHSPTERTSFRERINYSPISIEELNSYFLQVSLLLEGIGNMAEILQKEFDPMLVFCLYDLTEKLGDSNSIVAQSAWTTLSRISRICGYISVGDLISKNTDYLIDTICDHIKRLHDYPTTPQVLKGILQYANQGLVSLLEDTMDSVFNSLDTNYQTPFVYTFLQIMYNILAVFYRNRDSYVFPEKKENKEEGGFSLKEEEEEHFTKEEEIEDEELRALKNEEKKFQTIQTKAHETLKEESSSKEVYFTLQILEKIQYFLASRSRENLLLALEIAELGIFLLNFYQASTLLQMIHIIWTPLKRRFHESDTFVVLKTLDVVRVMSYAGKDFLVSKFKEDLWPIMKQILSSKAAEKSPSVSHYVFTTEFKLLKGIFQSLINIIPSIKASSALVEEIVQTCTLFLSADKHFQLQEEAVLLFQELIKLEPDYLWCHLYEIQEAYFSSPHPSLPAIKFTSNFPIEIKQTLQENVEKLIQYQTNLGI